MCEPAQTLAVNRPSPPPLELLTPATDCQGGPYPPGGDGAKLGCHDLAAASYRSPRHRVHHVTSYHHHPIVYTQQSHTRFRIHDSAYKTQPPAAHNWRDSAPGEL